MQLEEFLLARIADDEAEARTYAKFVSQNSGRPTRRSIPDPALRLPHPDALLAECQAKRAIVTSYQSSEAARIGNLAGKGAGPALVAAGMATGLRIAMQLLASCHHEHPDYQPEWRTV